jgi:aminopeptidase
MPTPDPELLERFADLAVNFAANVQPGQTVIVACEPGKEPLTRAVAEAAYRAGARFVDVNWFDPWVKRARLLHADADTLDFVPSWKGETLLEQGRQGVARIALTGPVAPGLFDDIDPARVGKDNLPFLRESGQVVNDRSTNWAGLPGPTVAWAELVYPELRGEEALEALWRDVVHVCRLDTGDPAAAWQERGEELARASHALTDRRFDAVRFEGPGTDLTVGLLPSSSWTSVGLMTRADGLRHFANLPSEETFTTPDPQRVDGVVRATKPLVLQGGTIVEGLEVEFAGGRAVRIDATKNAEALRALAAKDEGASRLGEVALVDREGRIGPLHRVFYDTLLDENAASHIALGRAYGFVVEDEAERARVNVSDVHIDFMIGSDDVSVTGVTREGDEVPVLREGAWQV